MSLTRRFKRRLPRRLGESISVVAGPRNRPSRLWHRLPGAPGAASVLGGHVTGTRATKGGPPPEGVDVVYPHPLSSRYRFMKEGTVCNRSRSCWLRLQWGPALSPTWLPHLDRQTDR